MPRTSTAERVAYVCLLCDQPLARDVDGQGWVRHTRLPEVDRLLGDDAIRAMMTDEDVEYLRFQGLCPFERGEKDENSPGPTLRFQYLEPHQGSNFRQWFVRDRRLRASTLFYATRGEEARSPEQVALDFDVPLDAVREAVEYCEHDREAIRQDAEDADIMIRAAGLDRIPAPTVSHAVDHS